VEPNLEVVQIPQGESFAAWSHGYPYRTVRWHFHPEYEIHLVVETSGRYFVGDFIGEFGRVIQFTEDFIGNVIKVFPELSAFSDTLELSRRGLLFSMETSRRVAPLMEALMTADGIRRVELFCAIIGQLESERNGRTLASVSYAPDPSGYMSLGINKALAFIRQNLTQDFDESDLAAIAGQTTSAFSRGFRRHTGMPLVQYLRRLRINLACQLLMSDRTLSVTDICFQVGFNNLSNFNRQFLEQKGMPPSRFRNFLLENKKVDVAA
jgi:AraC-like DNA-binding protein